MSDAEQLLRRYTELHNYGANTGDFSALLLLFAPDAELTFRNAVTMRLSGPLEIAEAFSKMPPDDALLLGGIDADDRSAAADYFWEREPQRVAGSLQLEARSGLIVRLFITMT